MRAFLVLVSTFLVVAGVDAADAVSPPVPMALPQSGALSDSVEAAAARIDQAILKMEGDVWIKSIERVAPKDRIPLKLPPPASDEVFIRRAYLDLHARLPDAATVRAFLVSTHPQKRGVLVDRLLADPMSGARRFLRLADMLRVKDTVLGFPMRPYVEWLREAAGKSMPYDQMVKALITSSGELAKAPASGFLMTDGGHMKVTMQEIMRVFLDENIQCASCHDHPYADTTQMQYYQLAACLTGAELVKGMPGALQPVRLWPGEDAAPGGGAMLALGEQLKIQPATMKLPIFLPKVYWYRDGKPGEAVKAGLPNWTVEGMGETKAFVPAPSKNGTVAVEFADWMVANPRFAEVAALRTWRELFGLPAQGADIMRSEDMATGKAPVEANVARSCEGAGPRNLPDSFERHFFEYFGKTWVPAQRQFAKVLGAELVRLNFNVREFERVLCRTQAYQRQSLNVDLGERGHAYAPVFRRLPAETIWNNLMLVLTDGAPASKVLLSHELPQVPDVEHPSRALGRGERVWGDDSLRSITHRLVRTLMTGDTVRQASAPDGPLVMRLKSIPHADLAVEEAFLAVLGRLPTYKEKMATLDYCIQNPGTGWSDTVWSLMNTSEFVFQY